MIDEGVRSNANEEEHVYSAPVWDLEDEEGFDEEDEEKAAIESLCKLRKEDWKAEETQGFADIVAATETSPTAAAAVDEVSQHYGAKQDHLIAVSPAEPTAILGKLELSDLLPTPSGVSIRASGAATGQEVYNKYYEAFFKNLKLGIYEDRQNMAELVDLLWFHSIKKWTSKTTGKLSCKCGFEQFCYEPIKQIINTCRKDQEGIVQSMLEKLGVIMK